MICNALVTLLVEFVRHCTLHELGKGLEIERTHRDQGHSKGDQLNASLFRFGGVLIYLTAAQGSPPRQVGNYHINNGVNALQLTTRRGRECTETHKKLS